MSKLPMANFKTMDKLLRHLGFTAVRQKGSHVFYRHSDGTSQPHFRIMANRDLARPLVREILREISISPDEFGKLLEKI